MKTHRGFAIVALPIAEGTMLSRATVFLLVMASCTVNTEPLHSSGLANRSCPAGYVQGFDENGELICGGQAPSAPTMLVNDMTATDDSATVMTTAGFPSSGILLVDYEAIEYSSTTASSFEGLSRHALGTTATAHLHDALVNDYLVVVSGTPSQPRMVVTGTGSVGIGTTSPTDLLHLESTSAAGAVLKLTEANRGGSVGGAMSGTGNGGALSFYTHNDVGSTPLRMHIDHLGYVGIGTSAPLGQLELSEMNTTSDKLQLILHNTAEGGFGSKIMFRSTNGLGVGITAAAVVVDAQSNYSVPAETDSFMAFHTTADEVLSEKMRITAEGHVGIGTTTPNAMLHVQSTGPDLRNASIYLNTAGTTGQFDPMLVFGHAAQTHWVIGINTDSGPDALVIGRHAAGPPEHMGAATAAIVLDSSGNVGIGQVSSGERLDVNGNIRASGNFISGGTTLMVPDYVFEPSYPLMSLEDLAAYVASEKHLPDILDAAEIAAHGVNLTEFQMHLLRKVEELTLYIISQDGRIDALERQNAVLDSQREVLVLETRELESEAQGFGRLSNVHRRSPRRRGLVLAAPVGIALGEELAHLMLQAMRM